MSKEVAEAHTRQSVPTQAPPFVSMEQYGRRLAVIKWFVEAEHLAPDDKYTHIRYRMWHFQTMDEMASALRTWPFDREACHPDLQQTEWASESYRSLYSKWLVCRDMEDLPIG